MSLFRTIVAAVVFASALFLGAAAPISQNVNTQDMDRSVKPGDDFYRYANGGWLARMTIPEGQSSYGTSAMLTAKTSQRVRDLIQGAAMAKAANG
ncbi:MAG TPA: hypothetical protein VMJ13_06345, partial [Candidatus Acidoferrum sp.]|nr:hypothetical protein [Candidatus Acidoferrum sp.]